MAAQAKYLFDQDFAPGSSGRAGVSSDHGLRLAEAEAKGFRDGFDAAEKEAAAGAERRATVAIEHVGDALDRLVRGFAAVETRMETESIELAVAIAGKLAPELVSRQPLTEIMALAADCFKQFTHAPHVIVRVNDALHAAVQVQLEKIASGCGFDGRLVIVSEPDIEFGDCKIEWADGGIVRDRAAINLAIGNTIARYLDARRTATAPKPGDIA